MSMTYEKSAAAAGQVQSFRIQFLHPHPLTIEPKQDFRCYANCDNSRQREGFAFQCHECNFNIHLECAFINKDEQLVRSLSAHQHPLMRFINVPKDRIHCRFCGKYCSEPTYACFPCNIFLHPLCFDPKFPREIQHFYHTCPLSLFTYYPDESYRCICRACYQPLHPGSFYYGCGRCGFEMHLDCTLFPTDKTTNQEQIHHFLHGHPLSLFMIKDGDSVTCYACRKRCTNNINPTYACFHPSCKEAVYICKTCTELPREICHPFHPYHHLTLLQQHNPADLQQKEYWTAPLPGSLCNACRKDTTVVVYICQSGNCSFRLHVGCSEIRAAIRFEGHNHLLHVKEIIDGQVIKCSACNIISSRDSYAFSCLDMRCDLNLHLTCGPIPYTIKHKCHVDHLILTHSLATFEDETNDEFSCDVCEEEREDPLLPIYQCIECKFAAEVKCVIYEVILSLKGEYGDVELRNPNGQLVSMITKEAAKQMVQEKEKPLELPDLILYEILESLSEDEKKQLGTVLEAIERETATAKQILSYDHDEVVLFSDKAYTQFMKFLDHNRAIEIPIDNQYQGGSFLDLIQRFSFNYKLDPKEEAVDVGEYAVTQKLAPILKQLLSKHGDISTKSLLSPKVKVFLFHMLCDCIYSMKNIKVVDITHDLLLSWSTTLKALQRAGFRIQFAVDHFKRVSRACFGLYVGEQVESALVKIDGDIDKLYKDIEALKVRRERITSAKSTKSTFMEECLRDALSLKRWRAGGQL